MSIKRQIQFKYTNFINSIKFLSLPGWFDSRAIRIFLIGAIVLVGSAYIIKTTSSTTTGYEMHKLEKEVAALDSEIQRTQIEIADYSSINSIQGRLAKMNMVEAGGIKYLGAKDVAVAKK